MGKNKKQNKKNGDKKNRKKETVKVTICPRCRSVDVGYIFGLKNLFGVIPKMKCFACDFKSPIFPRAEVEKSKLDKIKK